MTQRVSVVTGKGGTSCVIFTDEDRVDATMREWLLDVAAKVKIVDPLLVSTSPVQSGKKFEQLGIVKWKPYLLRNRKE